jgi:hypothetical protein
MWEKNIFFCILKVTEEKSGIRSWIRILIRTRIRIRTKISWIPNTACRLTRNGQCRSSQRVSVEGVVHLHITAFLVLPV